MNEPFNAIIGAPFPSFPPSIISVPNIPVADAEIFLDTICYRSEEAITQHSCDAQRIRNVIKRK